MTTTKLLLEEDLTDRMGDAVESLGLTGCCLILFDRNTYKIAGPRLIQSLERFHPKYHIFEGEDLHAGSEMIGRVMIAMADKTDFLVSCGSGCITDTVRYSAYKTNVPFVAFGTAASMDGYASSSSPLIVDGFKTTYPAKPPLGIFADTRILADAPRRMTAAGFGDVLAKTIALMDWRLARDVEGESYCPLIALLVTKAVDECITLSSELSRRDPAACGKLMQVLALTGIAIQMFGTTRPASGGEHHISHLLEIRDIQKGAKGSLHGDKVGIGTLISLFIYYKMFGQGMPEQRPVMTEETWRREVERVFGPLSVQVFRTNEPEPPSGDLWASQKKRMEAAMQAYGFDFVNKIPLLLPQYKSMIESMGGPVRPDQLGYTPEETFDAIAFGKEVRPKFTILRIAERYGWLYRLADEIARGLPEDKIY
jgi:glycerol-1-phosphate dehydrogenase [NAD(P)+]